MKLVLDDIDTYEFKKYLLNQEGIIDVEIDLKGYISEVNIYLDGKISPKKVVKYIELFQNNQFPIILSFDKGPIYKFRKLKYLVDDMCCEYCYKSLIDKLFQNDQIKSVKSNFDFAKSAFNIELLVEYNDQYAEEELRKYIAENI